MHTNIKPFRTLTDLVEIMNSRNIEINENTISKLYYDSHYSIVNGYKDLFIDKKRNNEHDDIYKNGTHFDEIYSLYSFDRELRSLFLKELMRVETFFKNVYFYEFYKEFGDGASYLNINNYNTSHEDLPKTIASMQSLIRKAISEEQDSAIKYCHKVYSYVPFWVLVRFLTFSKMYFLYFESKDSTRLAISKKICSIHEDRPFLNPNDIEKHLNTFRDFRNICAHDNIFYKHKTRNSRDVYYMYENIKYYLSKDCYNDFTSSLKIIINNFCENGPFKIINADQILNIMGFPKDWNTK
ncbi:MAG: Abi family protein [Firmicutes bacterium]|nr:Abi family protein [Bacillota bacterium]